MDEVRYERAGACALLTIDRPHRRNAINGAAAQALLDGYRRFEADGEARVLVLTGAGNAAFCAGADLKELSSLEVTQSSSGGPLGFTRLVSPKPTIAAISGWCVAGGLELALWCDLRVAARSARFGCLERRFGVPLLDGGTQRLPRLIGIGRALDLILTGRVAGAAEALAIGLVTEVVEDGRHIDRAIQLGELIAGYPQAALLADRRAAILGDGMELGAGLELESASWEPVVDEARTGASRFQAGEGRSGG